MRDFDSTDRTDWEDREQDRDERDPNAQEQRSIFLGDKPRFHPLAPTELEQRRLRRSVSPPDEAA